MSVLVDTSVWVNHFRRSDPSLIGLITTDQALTHPLVLGELACGTPPAPRDQTLKDVGLLRQTSQARSQEIMSFIEREKLYGLGCGLVDIALLTSTLMTPGARLWSRDRRLARLAARFAVEFIAHH